MILQELKVGDCFIVDIATSRFTCIILEDLGQSYWCDVVKEKQRSFGKGYLVRKISQQEFVAAEENVAMPVVTMGQPFVFRVMIEDGKWEERVLYPLDAVFKPGNKVCNMPCEILEEL